MLELKLKVIETKGKMACMFSQKERMILLVHLLIL